LKTQGLIQGTFKDAGCTCLFIEYALSFWAERFKAAVWTK